MTDPDSERQPAQTPAPHLGARQVERDLAALAARMRRVMPELEGEARQQVERAWVALMNALKQPTRDAARLARRWARLHTTLESSARVTRGEASGQDQSGTPTQDN